MQVNKLHKYGLNLNITAHLNTLKAKNKEEDLKTIISSVPRGSGTVQKCGFVVQGHFWSDSQGFTNAFRVPHTWLTNTWTTALG